MPDVPSLLFFIRQFFDRYEYLWFVCEKFEPQLQKKMVRREGLDLEDMDRAMAIYAQNQNTMVLPQMVKNDESRCSEWTERDLYPQPIQHVERVKINPFTKSALHFGIGARTLPGAQVPGKITIKQVADAVRTGDPSGHPLLSAIGSGPSEHTASTASQPLLNQASKPDSVIQLRSKLNRLRLPALSRGDSLG